MFELLHAFTTKLDALRFGMTDFNTAPDASGNEAPSWNYGENFGGHATSVSAGSTFTPYATMHHAADATGGMFGNWAVDMPENNIIPALDLHPCETMFAHNDGASPVYDDVETCKVRNDPAYKYAKKWHSAYVKTYNDLRASGVDHDEAHDAGIDAAWAAHYSQS